MPTSTGPLAIACLAVMYATSKCVSLISFELGAFFAAVQLVLLAGFALNCFCSYVLLRLGGKR